MPNASYRTVNVVLQLDHERAEWLSDRHRANLTRLAMALADRRKAASKAIAREALATAEELPEPLTPDTPIAELPGIHDWAHGTKLVEGLDRLHVHTLMDLSTRCPIPLRELPHASEKTWRRFWECVLRATEEGRADNE